MSIRTPILLVVAIAAAACNSSDATAPARPKEIRIVSGGSVTDTVNAQLAQALVVEVRDSAGALAPAGTVVRFTGVPIPTSAGPSLAGFPEVYLLGLQASSYTPLATGTTDQAGRTGVLLQLGAHAGAARVAIDVPTLGVHDTARFTIKPGAPARTSVSPADTTVLLGKSFTLRGGMSDRYGNPRSDSVTWTITPRGAAISAAGVVTANAVGRDTVTMTGVPLTPGGKPVTGTSLVSVVPAGRIVAYRRDVNPRALVAVDLDGANLRELTQVTDGGIGAHPAWIPGTNNVVFSNFEAGLQQLRVVDASGVVSPFLNPKPATMGHAAEPTPSRDGRFVFFSAFDSRCPPDYCLYRASITGGDAQVLGDVLPSAPSWRLAPSPDGSKVAYVTGQPFGTIHVMDVATKTVASWTVPGTYPVWSPTGTQIAYMTPIGGPVMIMNADGSGARALTPTGLRYLEGPMSWSSDGKWLVARGATLLIELIDTSTGLALPLGFTSGWYAPSIK